MSFKKDRSRKNSSDRHTSSPSVPKRRASSLRNCPDGPNSKEIIDGMSTRSSTISTGHLPASIPGHKSKTKFQCQRCGKQLEWEEANKVYRPRLLSPKRNGLLTKAKSERESSLKLSAKESLVPNVPFRRIVCFGDSNTWGFDPASQDRLEWRWPVVLRKELGTGYHVIEEGLCGRTINKPDIRFSNHLGFSRSGLEHIPVVLSSHKPLDLVIVYLGINDLKTHLNPSLKDIVDGMEQMLITIKNLAVFQTGNEETLSNEENSQILLLAPPTLRASEESTYQNLYG